MDRSIPYIKVIMVKNDTGAYPRRLLPEGYSFACYIPGYEKDWARIHYMSEQFHDMESAGERFAAEFLRHPEKLPERCFFICDSYGSPIATSTLWEGNDLERPFQRIHWVCVIPGHRNKGLASALMTKMLDVYHALGCSDSLYLTTQTWSYDAINIYSSFGFKPYKGQKPPGWAGTEDEFAYNNETAWEIINSKISAYRT